MEPGLLLRLSPRRKKWVILLSALGASSYTAYRVYTSPSVTLKRKKLAKIVGALVSLTETISDSAEAAGVVSTDLKLFLSSDSYEIPGSLKQIAKIATSDEFADSLQGCTEAMTIGIQRGFESNGAGAEQKASFSERAMEKVLSKSGTGFMSAVVGSFARNLVMGFYSRKSKSLDEYSVGCSSDAPAGWVDVVCRDESRELIGNCIQAFVSTAVAEYLEKTKDVNVCDELFSGMTNPKHEEKVRELLVSVCHGAVETAVRTSHKVLTSPASNQVVSASGDKCLEEEACSMQQEEGSGWIEKVSSTLLVPQNTRFVVDVTGRVTLESVRAFVQFMMWTLIEGLRRFLSMVHGEITGRGLQVIRYFGAKSLAIVSLCLALHLYVLGGTRVLLTA